MSRIGKSPITLPDGVSIDISADNIVKVKGKLGELTQKVDPDIKVKQEGTDIVIERPTEQKRHKALHGLYRSLISNMVVGVSEGYKKDLELVGVGFRAANQGQVLDLQIGFSHPVIMALPPEVKVNAEMVKGKNPTVSLESIDKQLIGQVAAKIRSLRKPEPYKGKGIKYADEVIRRKAGKTAAS